MIPDDALNLYDRFLVWAISIKNYVTAQYRSAAKALYIVTNNLLSANQKMIRWTNEFELLDLEQDDNSKKEFQKFEAKYQEFKAGPEYDSLKISCHEIDVIYENNLKGRIKEFLARDKKNMMSQPAFFRI
jgi:hypothetical protein